MKRAMLAIAVLTVSAGAHAETRAAGTSLAQAASNCQTTGSAGTYAIVMPRNGVCIIDMQRFGVSSRFRFTLSAPPPNGEASVNGLVVTYRPRPGYQGEDAFAVRWAIPNGPNGQNLYNVRIE